MSGFGYQVFLVIGNELRDGRRMTVDVVELERVGRNHGAQGVALAALTVNRNLHSHKTFLIRPL